MEKSKQKAIEASTEKAKKQLEYNEIHYRHEPPTEPERDWHTYTLCNYKSLCQTLRTQQPDCA